VSRRAGLGVTWVVLAHAILSVVRPEWSLVAVSNAPPRIVQGLAWWALLAPLLAQDRGVLARMWRLVRVEWLKTRRAFLFRAGLVATAGAAVLSAVTHDRLPHESGWTLAAHTSGAAFFAAKVFVLVLGATALSGEATGGTLKMILPHAYRRSDWIFAKAAVLVVVALLFALVAAGTSLAHAAIEEGLGDVTREAAPTFGEATASVEVFQTAAVMRGHLVETLAGSLAALVATGLLGVLLSCVFAGVVSSLCAAFLVFGILEYAELVLQLPREALQRIYAWYPSELRNLTAKLGRGLNERWDDALLPAALELSLVTSALALVLAVVVFSRRDLPS
jgi:ABC-type transport system involved in multi-copper enzyme maturation permease subunit